MKYYKTATRFGAEVPSSGGRSIQRNVGPGVLKSMPFWVHTSQADMSHCVRFSRTRSVRTIDMDVCMHDPYGCEQLQCLEQLVVNTFGTVNIITLYIYGL
jgi:hypothetical protein